MITITGSTVVKAILAIGVITALAGCVSDGYGPVGYYGDGMHGHHMYTRWDRNLHGNRCRVAYGNCNRFYNGYFYENPWWTMSY